MTGLVVARERLLLAWTDTCPKSTALTEYIKMTHGMPVVGLKLTHAGLFQEASGDMKSLVWQDQQAVCALLLATVAEAHDKQPSVSTHVRWIGYYAPI